MQYFRRLVLAVCAVALGGLAGPAMPQARHPERLEAAGRDWPAVGRLDLGETGFCTLTLIAPDRALTAAHCLRDGRQQGTGRPLAALQARFGYDRGQAAAVRGVRAADFPRIRAVLPVGPTRELSGIQDDLAVVHLDRPIGAAQVRPLALATRPAHEGQVLAVVSYARGRVEQASLQRDCILVERRPEGALVLDCEVDPGASGSPVLDLGAPEPRIVAVISARAETALTGFPVATLALAAPVEGRAGRALLAPADAGTPDGTDRAAVRVRRGTAPVEAYGPGFGARTVRPERPAAP